MTENQIDDADELSQVLAANVEYHAVLADSYNATQPHFRPENVQRVEKILATLADRSGRDSLLDLGCGTGFILQIAKKHFRRVVGADLTAAMLAKVDRSSGNIEVFETDTATLPFPNDTFDVCTAYSFLHHLYDLRPTLREAFRCLRPGGSFFSDADPNRAFWQSMVELRRESELSGVVAREARSVLDADREIAESTGLRPETVALAEFQKISLGGLDAEDTAALIRSVGFSSVQFRYEWYIGEGKAIHERSARDADMIGEHLRDMLPATRALFKYISFRATK